MKIAIQTLGCKVNQSDSSSIEALLRNNDFEIVDIKDGPDICIVNTCTVTAKSDYQSRQLIRRASRGGARVIATGCYAQLKPDELSEIEGLDLIIGNSGKPDIVSHVKNVFDTCNSSAHIDVNRPVSPLSYQPYASSRARAFLKIQDGCNFSCSYCAVPLARGKSRSMDREGVLKSVDNLVNSGYREIVLTGIHTGSYGSDLENKSSLLEIVREIVSAFKDVRLRLSSLEPQEFKDGLIDLIKEGRVCPHLHIPLQSGSDRILRVMNRGYTTDYYKQVINRIITGYPSISIGTDIITGFPGETDKDFDDTVKFLDHLPLSYLHVFPYSKRPDTKAALMTDHIGEQIKKKRVARLIEISNQKKKAYIARQSGAILNVIVENKSPIKGLYSAISDNYLRVFVKSESHVSGQNLKVRVISLTDNGLLAEPL